MKFLIFAAAAIAAVSANPINTGSSNVQRTEDGLGNYEFGYNENHSSGGSFRKEKGGPGFMSGSYGLRDADGRIRTVNYIADAHGYRASISTNEPGTDIKQDPAAVDYNIGQEAPALMAAPVAAHGPIATSYAMTTQHLAAPVMLSAPLMATKTYAAEPVYANYGLSKL